MTIPTFDRNRPRKTLPPDVIKQWRAGNIDSLVKSLCRSN